MHEQLWEAAEEQVGIGCSSSVNSAHLDETTYFNSCFETN